MEKLINLKKWLTKMIWQPQGIWSTAVKFPELQSTKYCALMQRPLSRGYLRISEGCDVCKLYEMGYLTALSGLGVYTVNLKPRVFDL